MKVWLLDNQIRIAAVFGAVCVCVSFLFGDRGPVALMILLLSLGLIYPGQLLFQRDTSENWLQISYGSILKNGLGAALLFLGWVLFLRGVFATAVASLLLRFS